MRSIKARVHVEDEGVAGIATAQRRAIGRAVAVIGNVFPCQGNAVGVENMVAQFSQGWQGIVDGFHRAIRPAAVP